MCECNEYDDRNVVEELRRVTTALDAICAALQKLSVRSVDPEPKPVSEVAVKATEETKSSDSGLTIEKVRSELSDVAKKPGGRLVIKDALKALGASKLTEVAADDWPKLLASLGETNA